MATLLLSFFGNEKSKKCFFKIGLGMVPTWRRLVVHEMLGLFLSAYVDDIKNGRQNAEPQTHMEEPDNETDREHRTPMTNQAHLGCTQCEAKVNQ